MFDKTIIERAETWLKWLSGISLFSMIPLTTIDVLRRLITGRGLSGTTQTVEILMLVTVFFAIGIAERNNQHIKIGLLVDRLNFNAQTIINILINSICISLGCVFVFYTFIGAVNSMINGETMWVGLSCILTWPFRFILPIGFLYWTLYIIQELIVNVKKIGTIFKSRKN